MNVQKVGTFFLAHPVDTSFIIIGALKAEILIFKVQICVHLKARALAFCRSKYLTMSTALYAAYYEGHFSPKKDVVHPWQKSFCFKENPSKIRKNPFVLKTSGTLLRIGEIPLGILCQVLFDQLSDINGFYVADVNPKELRRFVW